MKKPLFFFIVLMFFISSVSALDVCCEKTSDNQFCIYTSSDSCLPGAKQASTTCEQTSYCQLGCCYDSDEGRCFRNVPRAQCAALGNTWDPSASCDISQCVQGCCIIADQSFFVTEVRCKLETSKFPDANMSFHSDVETELDCISMARSEEKGCCVDGDDCTFTTRGNCPTASLSPVFENETSGDGLYKDMLCSNDQLSCDCAKQHHTGCLPNEEDVFWFDSCGNRENVYSSNKQASYNDGFLLPESESCTLSGPDDPDCGNCNYKEGTLCNRLNSRSDKFVCKSVDCDSVYDDESSPNSGGSKKNGESWCIYDGSVGHATDLVGSRHYRHICINGEEFTEPCKDFREEICIQGVLGSDPSGTFEAFFASGDYVEAACRTNRWDDCDSCNYAGSCGGECSGLEADQMRECCAKKCCNDIYFRDCYWMESGIAAITDGSGVCVPEVPPGLEFWSEEEDMDQIVESTTRSEPADLTTRSVYDITTMAVTTAEDMGKTTPSTEAESVCSKASESCEVVWKIGGVSRFGTFFGADGDWECIQNCHCTQPSWVIAGNNLCKAQGDCGAYFNIMGKSTIDGYGNTASSERKKGNLYFNGYTLRKKDVGNWNILSQAPKDEDRPGFWDEFVDKKGWAGLVGSAAIATGVAFFGGVNYGQAFGEAAIPFKTIYQAIDPDTIVGEGFATRTILESSNLPAKGIKFADIAGQSFNMGDKSYQFIDTVSKGTLEKGNIIFRHNGVIYKDTISESISAGSYLTNVGKTGATQIGTVGEQGTLALNQGVELEVAKGSTVTVSRTGLAQALAWVNTIMWIYTIYQLVDIGLTDHESRTYSVNCMPWQAPDGGKDCEECNEDEDKPCSLYKCKSLGKLCALVNEGTSEQRCVNIHPNDVSSPKISPWREGIEEDYSYAEISEGEFRGYRINEPISAFTNVKLGIQTDEPAQCKFSKDHGLDYDDMPSSYFGDVYYVYNHSIEFTLPTELATEEATKIINDGIFNIYVKCKDASGNENEKDYLVRFRIKPSPDLTPPVIELTSIMPGALMPSYINETQFSIYLDEPSVCRWNFNDTDFSLMSNEFSCATSGFHISPQYRGLYECSTMLEGVESEKTTTYFIRCQDKPQKPESQRNTNEDSFVFSLQGTSPLTITAAGPSGILYETEQTLQVVTEGGAEDGKALCGYHTEDVDFIQMIEFFKTNDKIHEQPLELTTGSYDYYVKCQDIAQNSASALISFEVSVDLTPPYVVYIYSSGSSLHVETSEPSICSYESGSELVEMTGTGLVHEAPLTEDVFEITCFDSYDNPVSFVVYPEEIPQLT